MKPRNPSISLAAKIAFTVWMLYWIPVTIWGYGPQNFLWLCNVAKFLLLYGIWTENRLILSSQAGVMTLVGLGWTVDFLAGLPFGESLAGFTSYMFNPERPLLARITSLYHIALLPWALWLVWRAGYDRRGPWLQCGLGAAALISARLLTEPQHNVNWVYEVFGRELDWLPPALVLPFLLLAYPLVLYFPGHALVMLFLRRFRPPPAAERS